VTAWLLVPEADGYFATVENVERVEARYGAFRTWTERHELTWKAVGLDFEPDAKELHALFKTPLAQIGKWLIGKRTRADLKAARERYAALMTRIRRDGFHVETYQVPLLLDDRRSGKARWQTALGLIDLTADREVVMLYSSLMGPLGPGLLQAYLPECRAVGVGSTGGGLDPLPKLSWDELERDLRVVHKTCEDITIFSLEGCVEQGFMDRLVAFDWEKSVSVPMQHRLLGQAARTVLRNVPTRG
jgi:hypothetical protein